MGNCISRCRPRKSTEKRKSLDRRNGSEGVASGEFPSNGDPCKVNTKMPGWLKEACSPSDSTKPWPRDEDLNGEATRNRFAMFNRKPLMRENLGEGRDTMKESETITWYLTPSDEKNPGKVDGSGSRKSSSAIPRLRKKDSIRKPCYKDTIMLADNIDSLVENEIPDEDDIKGAYARSSIATASPDFHNRDNEYPVWDGACVNGCGSDAHPQFQETWNHSVKRIDGEVEAGDLLCVPLDFQSVFVPNDVSSNFKPMDEEDLRVAQEIQAMLQQDVSKGGVHEDYAPQTHKLVKPSTEKQSTGSPSSEFDEDDSKLYSPTSSTPSIDGTMSQQSDAQLVEDIEYILNDDIGPDYANDSGSEPVAILEDKHVAKDVAPEEVSNTDSIDVTIKLNADKEALSTEREYVLPGAVYPVKSMVSNRALLEDENGFEFVPLSEDNSPLKRCASSCLKKSSVKSTPGNNEEMSRNIINLLQCRVEDDSTSFKNDISSSRNRIFSTSTNPRQCYSATSNLFLHTETNFSDVAQKFGKVKDVLVMDEESALKEELPSGKLNWYGAVPRTKSRNPRHNFAISVGKNGNSMLSMPRRYTDLGKQGALKRDHVEGMKVNWPDSQDVGTRARPKANNATKLTCKEETEMAKALRKFSDEQESSLKLLLEIRSPPGRLLAGSCKEGDLVTRKQSSTDTFFGGETNMSIANATFDLGGRTNESPYAKASDSSINTLRPMAARTSKLTSSHTPHAVSPSTLQDTITPRPPTTPKRTFRRPLIFVHPAPDTRLLGVSDRGTAAGQTDCAQSGAYVQSRFESLHDSEDVNYTEAARMANRKTTLHKEHGRNYACAHVDPGSEYDNKELKMIKEFQNFHHVEKPRMSVRKAADRADVRRISWSPRCGFGSVRDCEDLKSSPLIDRKLNRPETGKERGGSRRSKTSAESDSPSRIPLHRCTPDEYSHACAQTWTPGLMYTKEELKLIVQVEGQQD